MIPNISNTKKKCANKTDIYLYVRFSFKMLSATLNFENHTRADVNHVTNDYVYLI